MLRRLLVLLALLLMPALANARGIEPQRTTDHGSSISLYYADPDGNQIELKVDSLADNASQRAFLKSAEFKASPTGHPIDMDVFAASLEQTESR